MVKIPVITFLLEIGNRIQMILLIQNPALQTTHK